MIGRSYASCKTHSPVPLYLIPIWLAWVCRFDVLSLLNSWICSQNLSNFCKLMLELKHAHTDARTRTSPHSSTHTYTHAHTYTHTHAHAHTHTSKRAHAHHAHKHIHTHTQTYTQTVILKWANYRKHLPKYTLTFCTRERSENKGR